MADQSDADVSVGDDPVVHDEPVAHADADGQDREARHRASLAEPVLGARERHQVVLEDHRQPGRLLHAVGQGHLAPVQEGCPGDGAAVEADAAEADPDSGGVLPGVEVLDQARDLPGHPRRLEVADLQRSARPRCRPAGR